MTWFGKTLRVSTLTVRIMFLFASLVLGSSLGEPVEVVASKLKSAVQRAKGLSYSASVYDVAEGKAKLREVVKVKAMRPNMIATQSALQAWFSDGVVSYEVRPQEKQFFVLSADKNGEWLPSGVGFNDYMAPSYYRPAFSRTNTVVFEGKSAVTLEFDEPAVPGLSQRVFIDPVTYLPRGWDQLTAGTGIKVVFSEIDLKSTFPATTFRWTPPAGYTDGSKVKRVPTLIPVGTKAPLLNFVDSSKSPLRMSNLVNGKKALLLVFWYYGCGHCQEEFPVLQQLYKDAKSRGLEILLINEGRDPLTLIKAFVKKTKMEIKIATNGAEAVKKYGVEFYPSNVLLDSNGVVRYSASGYGEKQFETLREAIRKLGVD